MKIPFSQLNSELSAFLDPSLVSAVLDSYVEMQRRFLAGDWKPTELDAGRLCEAISRCVLQLDTGVVSQADLPAKIRQILLDDNREHRIVLKDRQHITKLIDVVYKFRSDRGAVHISSIHSANYMDSMLVVHAGKWLLAEFLRIAWNSDPKVIGEIISQIVQLDHSMIHELDGRPMVLAKNISTPDEILLLLNHAPSNRLTRNEIRDFVVNRSNSAVATAISRLLVSKHLRISADGEVALTPVGQKRVAEQILPKYSKTL